MEVQGRKLTRRKMNCRETYNLRFLISLEPQSYRSDKRCSNLFVSYLFGRLYYHFRRRLELHNYLRNYEIQHSLKLELELCNFSLVRLRGL